MRKLLVCVALLWVGAARAAGQEGGASAAGDSPESAAPAFVRLGDPAAESARLLKSAGYAERAWGAYLAGLHEVRGHAPLLVALLEDPAVAAGGWEGALLRQLALDALIRLGADVPAETLAPLYGVAPDEVVILLAREPVRNRQALLTLFEDESPSAEWLAVGNLLAGSRAQGFAARLLKGLKVEARVYVYDSEGDRGYNGGYGHGCGDSCSTFGAKPEAFPPVSYYSLTAKGDRGAVVVAPGRHAVYYLRTPGTRRRDDGCGIEKDEHRVEYLAGLLGTSADDLGLTSKYFREVVCKDARGCLRGLTRVRDAVKEDYASVVARLLGAGLLDEAEAAELKPDLTLLLRDRRDRRTFALPDRLGGVKVISPDAAEDARAGAAAEPSPDEPR